MHNRERILPGWKTCTVFVKFAACLALFTLSAGANKLTDIVTYPQGDSPLVQKYVDYNQRWFGGKLPVRGVEIEWGDLTGTYYTNYEGEGFHARISIIRQLEGYDNRVCMEVLHEMAHLKLAVGDKNLFVNDSRPVHDAKFQQEMLGLAKRGAFADCW